VLHRLPDAQLAWIEAWLRHERGAGDYLPSRFARRVALLHPGTAIARSGRAGVPFRGNRATEGMPSRGQKAALERHLLDASGPDAPACLGSYDATPDLPAEGPWAEVALRVAGDVEHLLVAGPLQALVFSAWEAEHPEFEPVSLLWPEDRRWFVTVDPDSSFTVVGCSEELARDLVADPEVRATDWPFDSPGT
jgi:hypothetical protein